MLLAFKSNGQYFSDSLKLNGYLIQNDNTKRFIQFYDNAKLQAYIQGKSDTLVILDTVITFYNNRIRFIKIGKKTYPLKSSLK